MTTMNEERAGFEAWLGITPKGAAHDLAYEAFKAGAAWQRAHQAERPGYMPIQTAEQLAEALANVRCFHDMSAELIAPELLKNLLAAAPAPVVPEVPALWSKSLGFCWAADADYPEGDWIVGTVDEDGNRYDVLRVEASQYDAEGESQKIAEAIVKLWAWAAHPAERQDQEALHVWRATTRFGETCHFGEASCAKAWAGQDGKIERVDLKPAPDLQVVEQADQPSAASVPAGCKVVPVELLERLEHVTRTLVPHLQCHVDLRALLASVEGGE